MAVITSGCAPFRVELAHTIKGLQSALAKDQATRGELRAELDAVGRSLAAAEEDRSELRAAAAAAGAERAEERAKAKGRLESELGARRAAEGSIASEAEGRAVAEARLATAEALVRQLEDDKSRFMAELESTVGSLTDKVGRFSSVSAGSPSVSMSVSLRASVLRPGDGRTRPGAGQGRGGREGGGSGGRVQVADAVRG